MHLQELGPLKEKSSYTQFILWLSTTAKTEFVIILQELSHFQVS